MHFYEHSKHVKRIWNFGYSSKINNSNSNFTFITIATFLFGLQNFFSVHLITFIGGYNKAVKDSVTFIWFLLVINWVDYLKIIKNNNVLVLWNIRLIICLAI